MRSESVITRLDTIVRNKYSNHPETLAAWKSATHIPRGGKSKKDEGGNELGPEPTA